MFEFLFGWFIRFGVNDTTAVLLARWGGILIVILFSILANIIAKQFILRGLRRYIAHTETKLDDVFTQKAVFARLSHLAPAAVIYLMAPVVLEGYPQWISLIRNAVLIYVIVITVMILSSLLDAILEVYRSFEVSRQVPLRSFFQVLKLIFIFIAGLFVIAIIFNQPPALLLGGLGASTAILMLIFRDSILGFVAGIQLTANNLVARGDFIEMPRYDASGVVLDVALTTVKVQNADKSITTIPTYSLISESFKNWRGMSEAGVRRLKRSLFIDINTIKLCDEEMLQRFAQIQYISEYIEQKRQEVAEYNAKHGFDDTSVVNGRRLTNIGTFRAYVQAYVEHHPRIRQDMTFLVRQLAPTEHGLPIEIYAYCDELAWAKFEGIQADIFDHLLAIVPAFDLRVFQVPAGSDFQAFAGGHQANRNSPTAVLEY